MGRGDSPRAPEAYHGHESGCTTPPHTRVARPTSVPRRPVRGFTTTPLGRLTSGGTRVPGNFGPRRDPADEPESQQIDRMNPLRHSSRTRSRTGRAQWWVSVDVWSPQPLSHRKESRTIVHPPSSLSGGCFVRRGLSWYPPREGLPHSRNLGSLGPVPLGTFGPPVDPEYVQPHTYSPRPSHPRLAPVASDDPEGAGGGASYCRFTGTVDSRAPVHGRSYSLRVHLTAGRRALCDVMGRFFVKVLRSAQEVCLCYETLAVLPLTPTK